MPFIARQEAFTCEHCSKDVQPLPEGSYRNHCPFCLFSKHVDELGPGDRASACGGMMAPTGLDGTASKGWILIHQCVLCGKIIRNKAAPDDRLEAVPRPEEL